MPHRVCKGCGNYNNRQVTKGKDAVEKTLEKKIKKAAKKEDEKEKAQA